MQATTSILSSTTSTSVRLFADAGHARGGVAWVSLFAAVFACDGSAARQDDEATLRRCDENKLISTCRLEIERVTSFDISTVLPAGGDGGLWRLP